LTSQIEWLKSNDDIAKTIAQNGYDWAKKNLSREA
jgi:hypothetical protein